MNTTKALPLVVLGIVLVTMLAFFVSADSQRVVDFTPRVYGSIAGQRMVPTQVFFDTINQVEIISDFRNNRFIYKKLSGSLSGVDWSASQLKSLRGPHAIAFHPATKRYFAVDTGNNQVISFTQLDGVDADVTRYSVLSGVPVGKRPHDIAYNSDDGFLYMVNSLGVVRFIPNGSGIREATFTSRQEIMQRVQPNVNGQKIVIGYMRSLTIIEGVVYLINSTHGNIIEIGNFLDPSTWTAHVNKSRAPIYAEAGQFDKDGLILNDIEFYKGYWYATNYYPSTQHNYLGSKDNLKNKIIRWKTWDDFYNSNWQDISHLAHPESIPYYFSKFDDRLFISMFHIGNEDGLGSGIYEISGSYF